MKFELVIEEGKNLEYKNVASFREKLNVSEIHNRVIQFMQNLKNRGAVKSGPMISTTHGVDRIEGSEFLDIEFLVPVSHPIELQSPYQFKQKFLLHNALYTRYVGDPLRVENAYNELLDYINKNKLNQISTVYSVNVNDMEIESGASPIIDLYVSINPNIV
ncbi:hypothetical protein J40TS1_43060 [Paenibacillus montaniterrae]|uniref:Uncharacterized protein n=1 Tax=Paenibacillus montaniterrae TaxID=429341 RepID=A0A919YV42_9BACL|nr:DUF5085 family protein [Paenibacillus montaniterrae]GIP18664.1 hypothetical protein J40TS1_43060 [Paenibacillus montaniterrae]